MVNYSVVGLILYTFILFIVAFLLCWYWRFCCVVACTREGGGRGLSGRILYIMYYRAHRTPRLNLRENIYFSYSTPERWITIKIQDSYM